MYRWKKLLAAAAVSSTVLAGCVQAASPETILTNGWKKDVQQVAVMGGSGADGQENRPARLDLKKADELEITYHVPAALAASATEAAGFVNAMMPNYLTVSAWKVPEKDLDGLVDETEQHLLKEQWLDAQPDGYSIFTDKDMIIVVSGIAEQTDPFVEGLLKANPDLVESASGQFATADDNDMAALLTAAWNADEGQVPIMGGTAGKNMEGLPAGLDLGLAEEITASYHVPDVLVKSAKQAAGFMNSMMPNYLTVSAWKVPEGDTEQLVQDVQDHVKEVQWLDAQPDGCRIYTGKDVLVVVIGITDQTDPFVSALQKADTGLAEAASVTFES